MSNRDRIPRTLNEAFGPHTSSKIHVAQLPSKRAAKFLGRGLILLVVCADIALLIWCFL